MPFLNSLKKMLPMNREASSGVFFRRGVSMRAVPTAAGYAELITMEPLNFIFPVRFESR